MAATGRFTCISNVSGKRGLAQSAFIIYITKMLRAIYNVSHLFIRHGKAKHNAHYERYGVLPEDMEDPDLVREGILQAQQTGSALRDFFNVNRYSVHLVASSPTTRTVNTARRALNEAGLKHDILLTVLAAERRLQNKKLNVGLTRQDAIDLSWRIVNRNLQAHLLAGETPEWWEGEPEDDAALQARGRSLVEKTFQDTSLAVIFSHAHLIDAVTGIEPAPGQIVAYSHVTKEAAIQSLENI